MIAARFPIDRSVGAKVRARIDFRAMRVAQEDEFVAWLFATIVAVLVIGDKGCTLIYGPPSEEPLRGDDRNVVGDERPPAPVVCDFYRRFGIGCTNQRKRIPAM